MKQIEQTIEIAAPLETVFALFADIRNHTRLSPPETRERLLDPGDIPMRLGTVVTLQGKYGGAYWTLRGKIIGWEPPGQPHPDRAWFQDEQVRGPFALWRHDHWFQSLPDGGTRLTDRFTFAAPFGPLGQLVERVWLVPRMTHLMAHIQQAAQRICETESAASGFLAKDGQENSAPGPK